MPEESPPRRQEASTFAIYSASASANDGTFHDSNPLRPCLVAETALLVVRGSGLLLLPKQAEESKPESTPTLPGSSSQGEGEGGRTVRKHWYRSWTTLETLAMTLLQRIAEDIMEVRRTGLHGASLAAAQPPSLICRQRWPSPETLSRLDKSMPEERSPRAHRSALSVILLNRDQLGWTSGSPAPKEWTGLESSVCLITSQTANAAILPFPVMAFDKLASISGPRVG
ncbi:uncharacterized protein PAC_13733 [Phialocephala subalpina]|uniref:Uncharacterized protein n=1 Tax=Phialocephala subalpina TaxID=576137 RepID=A0A1L7XFV1_9HELO|nr:uncharacterized protein PAC_13733 [Phialocephala subalpina]